MKQLLLEKLLRERVAVKQFLWLLEMFGTAGQITIFKLLPDTVQGIIWTMIEKDENLLPLYRGEAHLYARDDALRNLKSSSMIWF